MIKKQIKFKTLKTAASKRWFLRHINDPFVQQAAKDNLRNRAAYKLQEIDRKYKVLKKSNIVLDLGAAPGGWSQVVLSKIGVNRESPRLLGVDLLDIDPLDGAVFLKQDFFNDDLYQQIIQLNTKIVSFDVLLSDMSPNISGNHNLDHLRIIAFAERIADKFLNLLKKGGHFVTKLFEGSDLQEFVKNMRINFNKVYIFKPKSSRKGSTEVYCICLHKK